jgi:hypothetical protein
MKNRKFFILAITIVLAALLIGIIIAYRMYTKPSRSIENETVIPATATAIAAEFENSEQLANRKYLDKAVEVSGIISEISQNQQNKTVVTLSGTILSGVQCSLLENNPSLRKGQQAVIRGFCTGYLTDVVINQARIVSVK